MQKSTDTIITLSNELDYDGFTFWLDVIGDKDKLKEWLKLFEELENKSEEINRESILSLEDRIKIIKIEINKYE